MARKVVEMLVDDLDGTSIEDGSGGTVSFALDGTSYEIDLTAAHAAEFRELFADYVRVARVAGRPTRTRASSGRNSKQDLQAARAWLRAQGHTVSDRGRIPNELMELYRAAR